mmetsp:Transcript_24070/g.58126  ORF Transcript_24070/g.58126 Transcript_24070/m.58126 type:complete len:455 (+) Transcript_24070:197-1561(+)|eukprot:CAMPEP_0181097036 /NCGR_PEP_ID=MMETSP1071-20121207/11351_1 /TAXON_ID=35127 /ORGANISM="Thalassiosira sp., Strain NH16" /LENGTH=454 /DNA_ID=CAMNT_0023179483 /DNA_START=99 /DNA_END=1463 /DNA_ORIENTATION=+
MPRRLEKGSEESIMPPGKRPSTRITVVLFSIIYMIAFSNTFFLHNVFTRPFQQYHGPEPPLSGRHERVNREQSQLGSYAHNGLMESRITTSTDEGGNSAISEEITDGNTISSILLRKISFPTTKTKSSQRLRFHPGNLNLTQPQVLHHCYADPSVYKLHYPSSDRQVTFISDTYNLALLMIPKSGSSTGRWVMEHVLDSKSAGLNPTGDELHTKYKDHTVVIFVRDPLSRFYSQYDEVFLRYGPWMKKREGKAWQHVKNFDHPYPYLYENMTDWEDYEYSFCPRDFPPDRVLHGTVAHRTHWCARQQTHENGTLAKRFERFIHDYDGVSPWDLHLHLQVPHISNKYTGRPRRVDEIYNTKHTVQNWEYIVNWYGQSLPKTGQFNARSVPRRFDASLISPKTKKRICKLSAIDYCCLNMELPPECSDEMIAISCSLDQNDQGELRIQPWLHPHEI